MNVFFLHGFAGSANDWGELVSRLSKDIRPHCLSVSDAPDSASDSPQKLASYFKNKITALSNEDYLLCGYSMGGRIACLMNDENCRGMVLISSSSGLDKTEREARISFDHNWAELLERDPHLFWRKWYEQDIFSGLDGLPANKREELLDARKKHDPKYLAKILKSLSPARHNSLLANIKTSKGVLYIAGEKDKKYCLVGEELARWKHVQLVKIPECGHMVHIEKAHECAAAINDWFGRI